MRPEIQNILPILIGLGLLASLAMLRTLAIFRQRQIEAHNVAREAVRMRRDYEKQERERQANPAEA